MCRVMLQLILPGEVNEESKFWKDGAETDRIDAALATKRHCTGKLARANMHDLVQMRRKLGDEAQVNYLASMYEGT